MTTYEPIAAPTTAEVTDLLARFGVAHAPHAAQAIQGLYSQVVNQAENWKRLAFEMRDERDALAAKASGAVLRDRS